MADSTSFVFDPPMTMQSAFYLVLIVIIMHRYMYVQTLYVHLLSYSIYT